MNAMGGPNPFQALGGTDATNPTPTTENSAPAPNPWAAGGGGGSTTAASTAAGTTTTSSSSAGGGLPTLSSLLGQSGGAAGSGLFNTPGMQGCSFNSLPKSNLIFMGRNVIMLIVCMVENC